MRRRKRPDLAAILAAVPLLVAPAAAYALLVPALGGRLAGHDAPARLARPLFRLATAGGGAWPVSSADLLLAVALVVAFAELLKPLADRRTALINHALTIVLFVACLTAMLLAPAFATSTFFLITMMVVLDLAAGLILAMGEAREGRKS